VQPANVNAAATHAAASERRIDTGG
jgi:hypothetical protein